METKNISPIDISNFIAHKVIDGGHPLTVLKLQKLLYYVESWHIAFYDTCLISEDFQAWVHGPVCSTVFSYYKYGKNKNTYSDLLPVDVDSSQFDNLDFNIKQHINNVLETYAKYSGTQLEALTHSEYPWIQARAGLPDHTPSKNPISKDVIKKYYKDLIAQEL